MTWTIHCPICGHRDAYEFRFGGEVKGPRPEEASLTPQARLEWVHLNDNPGGPSHEWWLHRDGCGAWFSIWRDTLTNRQVPGPEDAR